MSLYLERGGSIGLAAIVPQRGSFLTAPVTIVCWGSLGPWTRVRGYQRDAGGVLREAVRETVARLIGRAWAAERTLFDDFAIGGATRCHDTGVLTLQCNSPACWLA